MPHFGTASEARLVTCHYKLQLVARAVIRIFDFTVVCGHRDEEAQMKAYNSTPQLSKALFGESPHNAYPSLAIDIAPYKNGIDWQDTEGFTYLAGHFMGAGLMDGIQLRWGYDWDSDEVLGGDDPDEHFYDRPHIELLNWKEFV